MSDKRYGLVQANVDDANKIATSISSIPGMCLEVSPAAP